MSWFGLGGKKDTGSDHAPEKTDMAMGAESFTEGGGAFGGAPSGGAPSGAPRGAAATQRELQQIVMQEQQKALVQQVISKLTEVSFDTCLTGKPDKQLSATERSCIHTVVGKYLDTSEFVIGRSAKQAQARQQMG